MSAFDYDSLAEAGVRGIVIEYHGAGDEGWIEEITPKGPDGKEIDIGDLHGVVERQAYDLLHAYYGGWEINEGSAGTIAVDVVERKTSVHHGWTVETTEYEDKEIS